ncbi:hypothetical protein VIBNISFn118_1030040 [Vibrio nigripulchritudo SFn118]|nr:hypothetical protein VIBNISFn118_1030040 [Vibrio nigripulchritudo SFn118]
MICISSDLRNEATYFILPFLSQTQIATGTLSVSPTIVLLLLTFFRVGAMHRAVKQTSSQKSP